jgi:hypothetical protein
MGETLSPLLVKCSWYQRQLALRCTRAFLQVQRWSSLLAIASARVLEVLEQGCRLVTIST